MPTTPPTITALPTPPNRTDPTTFSARADAWVAAIPTFSNQIAAVGANAFNNATEAQQSATSAASSASAASGSATAAATSASAAATSATTAVNAPGTSGTSTTSLTIGTGSQTLTTQTGKAWVVGQFVTVASTASPTNFMYGQITAYNSGTGSMTVSVLSVGGSGTLASWTIGLGGPNSTLTDQNSLQPVALTLPSIRPSLLLDFANSKKLDPRITFSRATSGTYYDGVTSAKAEENLLTYSEGFDNAVWAKSNATVTANAALAPNGTTTADKVISTGVDGGISQNFSGTSFANTLSIVDLQSGLVTSNVVGTWTSFVVSNAGNGWWRIAATVQGYTLSIYAKMAEWQYVAVQTFLGLIYVSPANTGTSKGTGNGTDGIFVWGAQLEQRSAATAYTPTTTQPITNYIPQLLTAPAGVPRFDHNPTTGESLGLLVEEQRTNLLTYSEDVNLGLGSNTNAAMLRELNVAVAPDGQLTADKIIQTGAGTPGVFRTSVATVNGTVYTTSIYAKAAGWNRIGIRAGFAASDHRVTINLVNGSIVDTPAGTVTVTSAGNGWWRIAISGAITTTSYQLSVEPHNTGLVQNNETPDGYSGIFIWGAQLEAGAFPTSYIPTTSASVTRTADDASMTGVNFSSWYRQDQGTIVDEHTAFSGGSAQGVWGLTGPNASENMAFFTGSAGGGVGAITADTVYGRSAQFFGRSDTLTGKHAFAYKTDDFAAVRNAGSVQTDTSGRVPMPINRLLIAMAATTQPPLNGHLRRLTYYPARLTNAQLQALTA